MKSIIIVLLTLECCLLGVTYCKKEKDPCDFRCHLHTEYEPICGNSPDGQLQLFKNKCYLSVANCKNPPYTVVGNDICNRIIHRYKKKQEQTKTNKKNKKTKKKQSIKKTKIKQVSYNNKQNTNIPKMHPQEKDKKKKASHKSTVST